MADQQGLSIFDPTKSTTEAAGLFPIVRRSGYDREAALVREGYPGYTTSAGWMGYPDDKVRRLCREGLEDGFTHFTVKVGGHPFRL